MALPRQSVPAVTGIDPSTMLEVGRVKTQANRLDERATLLRALRRALRGRSAAASLIAFEYETSRSAPRALRDIRCTRPGGTIAVLELGEPRSGVLAPFARFTFITSCRSNRRCSAAPRVSLPADVRRSLSAERRSPT